MNTNGLLSSQCSGSLLAKLGPHSTVVTMAVSTRTARLIDPSSFVMQMNRADGHSETFELPTTDASFSGDQARFQWVLPHVPSPTSATLTMWGFDGTRYDMGLDLAVQGAA